MKKIKKEKLNKKKASKNKTMISYFMRLRDSKIFPIKQFRQIKLLTFQCRLKDRVNKLINQIKKLFKKLCKKMKY